MRYVTAAGPELAQAQVDSRQFEADSRTTKKGATFKISGPSRIYVNEGGSGSLQISLALNNQGSVPPGKAISICSSSIGKVESTGLDGRPGGVGVTSVRWEPQVYTSGQNKIVYQTLGFSAGRKTARIFMG